MRSGSLNILDHIAQHFSEDSGFERVLMKYKIREISRFCQGSTMLDIGCGIGTLTKAFSPMFKKIVGIDGSQAKIDKALHFNSAENIEYVTTLFEDYSPLHTFDFIVSTNVLEHVDYPVEFLTRVKSWLSEEGQVAITVPNALGLHKRIGKAMGLLDDMYALTPEDVKKGHKRVYDCQRLRNDFISAGYTIAFTGGILLKPLSHKQMETWDEHIVDGLYEVGKELPEYCSSLIIIATR